MTGPRGARSLVLLAVLSLLLLMGAQAFFPTASLTPRSAAAATRGAVRVGAVARQRGEFGACDWSRGMAGVWAVLRAGWGRLLLRGWAGIGGVSWGWIDPIIQEIIGYSCLPPHIHEPTHLPYRT